MNKIALIFISLVFGIFFSGCFSFITDAIKQSKLAKEQEEVDCAKFERANLAKLEKKMDIYEKNQSEITIIDESKGILSNKYSKEFYCSVLEVTNSYPPETKSFAVNNGGFNDFSVKITKEAYSAQKIKEGEVIEKDVKITVYTLDKISIVKYQDYVYKADSLYIKKMRNVYAAHAKSFRRNLPCFDMNRKTYCDGDLVYVLGNDIMLRVVESGYGTVNYKLYLYVRGEPIAEASHTFMKYFQMNPPEVIGNHDLKKDEVPPARDLELNDIKTFKAW